MTRERRVNLTYHNSGEIELTITRKNRGKGYYTRWHVLSADRGMIVLRAMLNSGCAIHPYVQTQILTMQDQKGVWIPCPFGTASFIQSNYGVNYRGH